METAIGWLRKLLLILFLCLFVGRQTTYGGMATTAVPEVVNSFPHDTGAYTEGLLFSDGFLYESTGLNGMSSLRRVNLETGQIVQNLQLEDEYYAEGLTRLGERLYQLTYLNGTCFVYDRQSFQRTGLFTYEGEGWGLATDGVALIMSNGSDKLHVIDPATFTIVRTVNVKDGEAPVELLNELEWVGGEVWANVWHSNRIARIDMETGQVLQWLDLERLAPPISKENPDAVLNGIAFDPETGRTFVTGKLWPFLFEIRLAQSLTVEISGTGSGTVTSNPVGISCTSGVCSHGFPAGQSVTLLQTPSFRSLFGGWANDCSGIGMCSVSMNVSRSVTAIFTAAPRVVVGAKTFSTLQTAYDDISTATGAVIKLLEGHLTEGFTAGRGIAVKIEGGYDASYSEIKNHTTIQSPLLIRRGAVRARRVNVR